MEATSYKDLRVWQQSMDFATEIYKVTSGFPREELYGLTSQLRRAAVSVPANIAEGNGRATRRDYAHFTSIALSSARELETLVELTAVLGFASRGVANELQSQLNDICRMLFSLHRKLATPANGRN